MRKILLVSVCMALLLVSFPVLGAEFIAPQDKGDGNISVPASQTHRNLYTAGSNVSVNGETLGDLFAAGGVVTVAGRVEADATVAGGNLTINAPIGGDARLAGGTVTINNTVGGDLLVGAGNFSMGSNTAVGGDLVLGSGNATIDGPVTGKVLVSGDSIRINSKVTGEVKVYATSLTFGPNAVIAGRVIFNGPKEAVVEEGAQVGTIEFHKVEGRTGAAGKLRGLFTLGILLQILATLLVGWLFMWYHKSRVIRIMNKISVSPLATLGLGFAAVILTPILAFLLLFTFIGYYLAFLLMITYVFVLAVAWAVASIYAGSLLMQWYRKTPELEFNWKTLLLGVVVLRLVCIIPIVGWLVSAVLFLMAVGSMVIALKPVREHDSPPPTIIA